MLVASQQRKCIPHSSKAGSLRWGYQQGQVLAFSSRSPPSYVSLHGRNRTGGLSGVLSIRTLIPSLRASPLWPNHFSKASASNIITLGVRFQHTDVEGSQTFSSLHMVTEQTEANHTLFRAPWCSGLCSTNCVFCQTGTGHIPTQLSPESKSSQRAGASSSP